MLFTFISVHLLLIGSCLGASCFEPRPSALPSAVDLSGLLGPGIDAFCNSAETVSQNQTLTFEVQAYELSSSLSGTGPVQGNITLCQNAFAEIVDEVKLDEELLKIN